MECFCDLGGNNHAVSAGALQVRDTASDHQDAGELHLLKNNFCVCVCVCVDVFREEFSSRYILLAFTEIKNFIYLFVFLDFFHMPGMKQLENREARKDFKRLKDSNSPPSVEKIHQSFLLKTMKNILNILLFYYF